MLELKEWVIMFLPAKNERWVYHAGERQDLLSIEELVLFGYDHFQKAAPLTSHAHEQAYEFVYVEQGAVSWEVNGENFHTHAQQVFFTRPGERHRASMDYIGPCTIWWMIIRDPMCDEGWLGLEERDRGEFARLLKYHPRVSAVSKGIVQFFERLRRLLEQTEPVLLEFQVRHNLLEILLQLMHTPHFILRSPDMHEFTVRLTAMIQADPALRLTNAELAAEVGLSESHFYRVFKETNGQSPTAYMERVRMDCACRQLKHTNALITRIAMDMGFKTSQHFATVFKKYMGMTPKEWRRQE